METFVWMLRQAFVPMLVGFAMAISLSRWSQWSSQRKIHAGMIYEGMLLLGMFAESLEIDAPLLHNIAIQLRGGVIAAFGITLGMSLLRLSVTWKGRLFAGRCIAVHLVFLWLGFEATFHLFNQRWTNSPPP